MRRSSRSVSTWVPARLPINVSGVRITLNKKSDNEVSNIWVKFGPSITMVEAETQRFVAHYLEDNDIPTVRAPRVYLAFTWCGFGYIVTEYIDGQICGDSDIPLVAAAVQSLITIQNSTSTPGPVGGGLIEHPFFVDRTSSIWCESVEELQDHMNSVSVPLCLCPFRTLAALQMVTLTQILRVTGRSSRVNFEPELASHGLRLCVSDLMLVNFMRDGENRIVAVDFGGCSFLPPSFFGFALNHTGPSSLKQPIARVLMYPPSTAVAAMVSASCALAQISSNNIGEKISLTFSSLSPPYKKTEFNVLHRSSNGAPIKASSVNGTHKSTPG